MKRSDRQVAQLSWTPEHAFATKAEAVLARTVDAFAALPGLLDTRPATENPVVAVREAFCEFAVMAPRTVPNSGPSSNPIRR